MFNCSENIRRSQNAHNFEWKMILRIPSSDPANLSGRLISTPFGAALSQHCSWYFLITHLLNFPKIVAKGNVTIDDQTRVITDIFHGSVNHSPLNCRLAIIMGKHCRVFDPREKMQKSQLNMQSTTWSREWFSLKLPNDARGTKSRSIVDYEITIDRTTDNQHLIPFDCPVKRP